MTLSWCIKTKTCHICVSIHSDCSVVPKLKSFGKIGRVLEIIRCKHYLDILARLFGFLSEMYFDFS